MIRMESSQGVGYSVADLGQVRYIFAGAVPQGGGDLRQQAHDALTAIEAVVREEAAAGSVVRQTVFVGAGKDVEACRKIVGDFYGPELPATSYVVQPPCDGKRVVIEAWAVSGRRGPCAVEWVSENMVVVRHSDVAWAHCAGILPGTDAPAVYDRALSGFRRMRDTLGAKGFGFGQVVRTWLYLGDIVGPEGDTQRYKELNRARADFFESIRFLDEHVPPSVTGSVFPASTGIGASDRDVTMGCIALTTDRRDLVVVPLENPLQTSAFDYGSVHSPQSPKFCRAKAILGRHAAAILVSGTASIVDSETRFVGDVEGQTRQTLENIQALIARENFERSGVAGVGATLRDLVLTRVYIKRQEDYGKVKAACQERLGEAPAIYVVADVCRPELLVELEAIAFTPRT